MSVADRKGVAFVFASWMRTWPRRYSFALLAVCAAIALQRGLEVAVGFAHSFLLFYPTILIVSLLAGFSPGLTATLLCTAAAQYFYLRPGSPSQHSDETEIVGIALFLLVGITISWLGDLLRRRANRLQEFARVVEGLDEMIIVVDRDYRYLIANSAFLNYRGLRHEEVIGHRIPEIVSQDVFEKTIKGRLEKCFRGETVQYEISYEYPDRGKRELFVSNFPIWGPTGVDRVACMLQDVTDRKQRELELRESEDRYRDLVENSEDLVCTHDLSGKLLSVNPAASRLLGYEVDELLHIPMRQLVAPEVRSEFGGYLARIQAKGSDCGFLCVVAKDGRRRIWEYRNTLRTQGVALPIVGGIARDVTERCIAQDALRRSEQRMRLFIEHAPAGAALFDREMRYVQASRRWRDDYGLGDRDIIGVSHYELFPELPERWKEAHRRCLAGKVLRHDCDRFERADGKVQWIRWELHPWYEKGEIGGVAIFAEDVTAREEAINAVRRSEQRYRDLFEKAVAGVGMISFDGRVIDCNDAWARMFGFKDASECRAKVITQHYRDVSKRELLLTELKRSGAFLNQEWELLRLDGTPFWVLLNSVLIRGEDGEPLIQSTMFEITKRKRAEDALRRSEEHFRILVEQASEGIGIADAEGRWIDVNSAWAAMMGKPREKILQQSVGANLIDEDLRRIKAEAANLHQGQTRLTEFRVRRDDGSVFPVEASAKRLPDGRLQVIARDITERRRAQEYIRQSEERFRVALKDSPITVFNQDLNLRYTWVYNPQLYWQQDLLGKTDDEIMGSRKVVVFDELKRRVLESGSGAREEIAIPNNGTSHVFDITVEPLFDSQRRVIGITAACMNVARLREIVDRLEESRARLANEKSYLESEIRTELGFEDMIGQSPALHEVLAKARVVAPTNSTVLLLGETGTGKELVARSVHRLSGRSENNFIKLNCAAVPSGLLESELFGHEKGAFTGAVNQKIGRIELADKGTLFLDEVGELPPELQPKLLRVLQDREFERLGGIKTLRVDVRIISATNRDLWQDIADKKFREDLFYRLNVFPIVLPPLRERRDDIQILVQHFVTKYATRMGKRIEFIPEESMRVLRNWSWPGNVRELENMIERMVIMTKGATLAAPPAELSTVEFEGDDNLSEMERDHILRVLRETNGVLSGNEGAASRLGLKRTTLQSMIKRLGIEPQEYRGRRNGTFGRP